MMLSFSRSPRLPVFRLSLAFCLLTLTPLLLHAQTAKPDTLPRLSPQEIEIRGELRVSFPSIARQPLTGFAPAPRLKIIDPARKPFLPPYRQTNLPPSPLERPMPPPLRVLLAGEPRRGVIEAGAGSYFTRFARFYLDVPASPVTSLYASADYKGSYGHEPFGTEARAPFDQTQGSIGIRSGSRRLSVEGDVGGFYRSYTLYGATPDGSVPAVVAQPDREGVGGHARVRVDIRPQDATSITAGLHYGSAFYDSGTQGSIREMHLPSEIDETRLTSQLGLQQRLESGLLELGVDGGGVGLDGGGTPGTEQTYASAGGAYTFISPLTRLRIGARLLATNYKRADGTFRTTLFAPDVSAQLRLSQFLEIYAHNRPYVAENDLATLFEEAPYLTERPDVRPTAIPYNAEGGVRVAAGDVQVRGWAGYLQAPRLRYFAQARGSGFSAGSMVAARYAEGQILSAGADVRVLLVEGLHAALGGKYRSSELARTGQQIPYLPAAEGWASLGYLLPGQKVLVKLVGTLEGTRYSDPREMQRVPPYTDLDASASFEIRPGITLVGRLDNLIPGNREWWRGYPEAAFTAMAGLSVRW